MNAYVAKNLLKTFSHVRRQPIWDSLNFLEKSQWWTDEEILNYQEKKLNALLIHSYRNVPFYKDWFDNNKCTPSEIKLDDIKRLPIIEKKFFRNNLGILYAKNPDGPYEEAKTSGSTGLSLRFHKSLKASAKQYAAMIRGHRWHGVDAGDKEARLWGIPVNRNSRIKIHLIDFLLNRFREREYNLNSEILNNFHEKILSKKPVYLMGYTSMVVQFARHLETIGFDGKRYRLKMVKCTSETIHEIDYEIVERVFGCPLVSEYGAAEAGLISFQCEAGNQHLMADCCLVEFLDPVHKLTDKDLKEIVVTNFDNYALPVIRYKIGDFAVKSDKKCECGRSLPLIERIVGRTSDVIKSSDGRVWHSIIIYYIMKGLAEKFGGVKKFKAVQRKFDSLEILVVPDKTFSEKSLNYLFEMFAVQFGANFKIEIKTVEDIPREASGKLRDFSSAI